MNKASGWVEEDRGVVIVIVRLLSQALGQRSSRDQADFLSYSQLSQVASPLLLGEQGRPFSMKYFCILGGGSSEGRDVWFL